MGFKFKNIAIAIIVIAAVAMYFGILSISLPSVPIHINIGGGNNNQQTTTQAQTHYDTVRVELVKGSAPVTMNRSELQKLPVNWMMGNDEVYHNMTSPTNPSLATGNGQVVTTNLPKVEINDPKDTSAWTDPNGKNIDEVQTIGTHSLNIDYAPSQTKGAISWDSLKDSKDKFNSVYAADLKTDEKFGAFIQRTSGIWGGDDAESWSNTDGYKSYLVKYSNTEYYQWEITPDYNSGNFPTSKDDLKPIQYGTSEVQKLEQQQPAPQPGNTNPTGGLIPGGSSTSSTSTGGSSISEQTGGLIPS